MVVASIVGIVNCTLWKMTERTVTLTSYSLKRQDSIDTYFHEWQSIRQHSIHQVQSNENSNENDDEIELGKCTRPAGWVAWGEMPGLGQWSTQKPPTVSTFNSIHARLLSATHSTLCVMSAPCVVLRAQ